MDALITKEPGCCICISTADCSPIICCMIAKTKW
ncbi:MAG: laccase domain-containing protein [Bacteroides cellulosilyticus]